MRYTRIAPEEYYHIYNRGADKQVIFRDRADHLRFLFLILYLQSPITFDQMGREVKRFVGRSVLDIAADVVKNRFVELVAFCLMPNHFHLIVRETEEGGISRYMHKVLSAYAKYANAKYGRSGHLFQGPYQAVHVADDRQLLHLSAYVHKNPAEWQSYGWSSYKDFCESNRWSDLLVPDVILGSFADGAEYRKFVHTSLAKETEEELSEIPID